MRSIVQLSTLLLLALSSLSGQGQSNVSKPRLAVVAESPLAAPAGDVLEAVFSKSSNLDLLDRAQVARIFREQALSARHRDDLKLGKILAADGLLILEPLTEGTNQFLLVRLVAVKAGVQLRTDRFPWPIGDMEQWATGAASYLAPYLSKLTVLAQDAVPISVVGMRSSMRSASVRELEHNLTLLTIERLSREERLFLLERRKMESLLVENEFHGVDESAFWRGSYLLEGAIDRDTYSESTITLHVRLVPPGTNAAAEIKVSGSRTNLVALMNTLAEEILTHLEIAATATMWSATDEAEKFLRQAQWADRWGLYAQAQTAGESAWALGLQTKEVAALRIRAYADEVWPEHKWSGNLIIPRIPESAQLAPLKRALELYQQNALLFFANAPLDEEWFGYGLRVIRASAAILDGFYHTAELRAGNEDELGAVRLLTRQALAVTDDKMPPHWITNGLYPAQIQIRTNSLGKFYSLTNFAVKPSMYDTVKWYQGGIFFEEPEQAIPLFRAMLTNGYVPSTLPRITGWKWEDRKRIPRVTRRFVEELCASTNPGERLNGLLLRLIRAEFHPEEVFHRYERELVEEVWHNRAWVLRNAATATMLSQIESVLREKCGEIGTQRQIEPFASLKHQLFKEYLRTATAPDERLAQGLFRSAAYQMPLEHARELLPLLDSLPFTSHSLTNLKQQLRKRVEMTRHVPERKPISPTLPETVLLAKFVRWAVHPARTNEGARIQVKRVLARGNNLWADIAYIQKGEIFDRDAPHAFLKIDPASGLMEEIPFPERLGPVAGGFDVSVNALYVSGRNRVHRYDLQTRHWETFSLPMEGSGQLVALHNQIYISSEDGLLEMDRGTRDIRVLVSLRRTPALSELDSLWKPSTRIYPMGNAKLGVIFSDRLYSYEPVSRTWAGSTNITRDRWHFFAVPHFSSDGAQLLLTGPVKRHLVGFWNDHRMELLVAHEPENATRGAADPLGDRIGPSRWDWPAPFDLEAACFFVDGSTLNALNPRKIRLSPGAGPYEPIAFPDDRHATFLRFEPEFRQALSVPVRFESDGSGGDPFEPRSAFSLSLRDKIFQGIGDIPFWLSTSSGYVFAIPEASGHWLLPTKVLDESLAVRRKRLQENETVKQQVSGHDASGSRGPMRLGIQKVP